MHNPAIRVAVISDAISHFEAPLYRLLSAKTGIALRVFYLRDPSRNLRFDVQYQTGVNWGEDVLDGYPSQKCGTAQEIGLAVARWHADTAIIYGYSWPGSINLIVKLWRQRLPLIFRGTLNKYIDRRRRLAGALIRPVRLLIFHFFKCFHYGGDYSRAVIRSAGISEKRLFLVPYSVDTPYFLKTSDQQREKAGQAVRQSLGWAREAEVVLWIGQVNWVKGPDIAVDAFANWAARRQNARLLFVGSGAMLKEVKHLARKRGIENRIHFAGFCPSKSTVPYYLASDVVLFTSRYETWARAVNEAMLCQRPVIVNARIPSSGGLVRNNDNGIVATGNRPRHYVKALEAFVELSADAKETMGTRARLAAQEFSYEAHEDDLMESIYFASGRTCLHANK
jgi:glycosyltransferase involved in cell wall biosynthesis